MGLTWKECVLFTAGSFCLAFFLLRTVVPSIRTRLDETVDATSRSLREDFFSFSPVQVRTVLLLAGSTTTLAAITATRNVMWTAAIGSLPLFLGGLAARLVRAKRRKRVVAQLPALLDVLSGHLKAGRSVSEAFHEAVPLLPSGIREEIAWLCQAIRLGTPLSDTLLLWECRMACEEVSLIVRPLRIAIPAGGNLYELLARCRDVLRAKTRHAEKMRSMTAQARLQALVLTLLPIGFIVVLSKVDPDYLVRCQASAAGKTILATAAFLQILGWLSIRKIMGTEK